MLKQTRCMNKLLLCLCCQLGSYALAQSALPAKAPAFLPAADALRAAVMSGEATPFDALSPYGKREAIRQLRWRENKLVGFGIAPLIRELDREQLAAVLHFIDAGNYLPMLEKRLVGRPLRPPMPSALSDQNLQLLRQLRDADNQRRAEATEPVTEVGDQAILRRYQALFGADLTPARLSNLPLGDLVILFDAASLAATGNPDSPALDDMLQLHRELSTRDIDTRRTLDDALLQVMLAARRFEQARKFSAGRPHLSDSPIPHIVDPLGPTFQGRSAFSYDAQRNALTRVSVPAPVGMELVMVVGSGCHNSTNALQAIRDDRALQARLHAAKLTIITAPDGPVETGFMTEWNAANPLMPIRAPYNAAEWQAIKVSGLPAFYLLRKGKVADQRIGWPGEGKQNLLTLIEAGTLDPMLP